MAAAAVVHCVQWRKEDDRKCALSLWIFRSFVEPRFVAGVVFAIRKDARRKKAKDFPSGEKRKRSISVETCVRRVASPPSAAHGVNIGFAVARGKKRQMLAVRRPCGAGIVTAARELTWLRRRWGTRQILRGVAIGFAIGSGDSEGDPLAVGRNGGLGDAMEGDQVVESHGALRLRLGVCGRRKYECDSS